MVFSIFFDQGGSDLLQEGVLWFGLLQTWCYHYCYLDFFDDHLPRWQRNIAQQCARGRGDELDCFVKDSHLRKEWGKKERWGKFLCETAACNQKSEIENDEKASLKATKLQFETLHSCILAFLHSCILANALARNEVKKQKNGGWDVET